ncbi:MAG: ABC transporter ATP-binding protein, partial [Alcaligenes sp.]
EILLMDEPFAALDALTRAGLQQELLALSVKTRLTLLFVTHSIEEALLVGTRILLLSPHPGQVRAELHAGAHQPGSPAFDRQVRRIHDLLFGQAQEQPQRKAA